MGAPKLQFSSSFHQTECDVHSGRLIDSLFDLVEKTDTKVIRRPITTAEDDSHASSFPIIDLR
jgi:hypothetical protein